MNYAATSFAGVTRLIGSGQAKVGIIFPPDFAKDLRRGGATVQVIVELLTVARLDASSNQLLTVAVAMFSELAVRLTPQTIVPPLGRGVLRVMVRDSSTVPAVGESVTSGAARSSGSNAPVSVFW